MASLPGTPAVVDTILEQFSMDGDWSDNLPDARHPGSGEDTYYEQHRNDGVPEQFSAYPGHGRSLSDTGLVLTATLHGDPPREPDWMIPRAAYAHASDHPHHSHPFHNQQQMVPVTPKTRSLDLTPRTASDMLDDHDNDTSQLSNRTRSDSPTMQDFDVKSLVDSALSNAFRHSQDMLTRVVMPLIQVMNSSSNQTAKLITDSIADGHRILAEGHRFMRESQMTLVDNQNRTFDKLCEIVDTQKKLFDKQQDMNRALPVESARLQSAVGKAISRSARLASRVRDNLR